MRKARKPKAARKQSSEFIGTTRREGLARSLRQDFSGERGAKALARVSFMYNAFRSLVWDFRRAHGWRNTGGREVVPKAYFGRTLDSYKAIRAGRQDFEIIRFLSSRQAINAIIPRGRMRQKPPELSKAEMRKLQKEMNAVLRLVFSG